MSEVDLAKNSLALIEHVVLAHGAKEMATYKFLVIHTMVESSKPSISSYNTSKNGYYTVRIA